MTINYTSLLGLAQPVTGTESGTWGTVVNDEITALVEEAVAGGETIDVTAGNVTLTTTNGVANQARNAILLVTGTPGTSRNVVAPSSSKVYIVKNSSDGEVVLKGSATTGVTIPVNVEALCFWNGSDFEIAGMTGPASATSGAIPTFNGTTGKVLQNNSGVTISAGVVTATGFSGPINGTVGATTPTSGVFTQVDITAQGDLRLQDTTGGQYVALQAPGTVANSYTLTLPAADGTSGQAIVTDGAGTLSFSNAGISTGKSIAMAMIFGF
jgi:hypothetical protein